MTWVTAAARVSPASRPRRMSPSDTRPTMRPALSRTSATSRLFELIACIASRMEAVSATTSAAKEASAALMAWSPPSRRSGERMAQGPGVPLPSPQVGRAKLVAKLVEALGCEPDVVHDFLEVTRRKFAVEAAHEG